MKCPECIQKIHATAEECPHCGMDLESLEQHFLKLDCKVQNGILDLAGVLRKPMRDQLVRAIKDCEKQFKNVSVALCFVALEEGVSLESFGFWVVNEGEFIRSDGERDGDGRVVVVLEMKRKIMSMSYGYMLDEFVRDGECFDVLSAGHASLLEKDYVAASEQILTSLRKYLRKVCRRANSRKGKQR